jgi:hypothetical protein
VWYLFSTSATFTNKVLIKEHHVSAEMLTMCHLFISILLDCETARICVICVRVCTHVSYCCCCSCGADVP